MRSNCEGDDIGGIAIHVGVRIVARRLRVALVRSSFSRSIGPHRNRAERTPKGHHQVHEGVEERQLEQRPKGLPGPCASGPAKDPESVYGDARTLGGDRQ